MNEANNHSDPLIEQLKRLRPAKSGMDLRGTFYQAGFAAGQSQAASSAPGHRSLAIAASLLGLAVAIPSSYFVGAATSRAINSRAITEQVAQVELPQTVDETLEHTRMATSTASVVAQASDDLGDEQPRSAGSENTVGKTKANRLAGWMNPLANIARSAQLDRHSEATLTSSHASLFLVENAMRNLSDFPLAFTSTRRLAVTSEIDDIGDDGNEPRSTLAVGDLRAMAIGLETSR